MNLELTQNPTLDDVLACDEIFSSEHQAEIRELAKEGQGVSVKTYVSKPKPLTLTPFVVAFTDNLDVLLKLGITPTQLKILTYVLKAMEYGNLVNLNQKAMAKDLELDSGNLSRNLKALERKGVLVKHDGHTYLNSNLFIKGLKSGMDKARRDNLEKAKCDLNGKYKTAFK